MLERPVGDKHSSLSGPFVDYERESFIALVPVDANVMKLPLMLPQNKLERFSRTILFASEEPTFRVELFCLQRKH